MSPPKHRFQDFCSRAKSVAGILFSLSLSSAVFGADESESPEGIETSVNGRPALHGPRLFTDGPRPLLRRLQRTDGEANSSLVASDVGNPDESPHPVLDKIWSWPVLYQNYDNPYIQEVSLLGRYHGQYYATSSDQGSVSGWDSRRSRIGLRTIFLNNFTLASSFNFDTDSGGLGLSNVIDKENLDTLTLAWKPSDEFQVVIGQQKPGFIYEYDISSNEILTFERSLIVNQLAPDKSPGISIEGKFRDFFYEVGGYSGNELGDDFGDGFALLKLGYDFSGLSDFEKMNAQFYYFHNSSAVSPNTASYHNAVSLSLAMQEGPFAGIVQTVFANGYGRVSDSWGLTVMPSAYLKEDKLQLVGRYQFARSSAPNGLQAQNRYEQDVPFITNGGRGEKYHAAYLGLNWYLYGRRLKVMNGVEYSHMDGGSDGGDFSGWTLFSGLRLHF
tara:strand:+ start:906 stop:2237 length:1332 start_codon:yes stop_codon:yes gene_type:complete